MILRWNLLSILSHSPAPGRALTARFFKVQNRCEAHTHPIAKQAFLQTRCPRNAFPLPKKPCTIYTRPYHAQRNLHSRAELSFQQKMLKALPLGGSEQLERSESPEGELQGEETFGCSQEGRVREGVSFTNERESLQQKTRRGGLRAKRQWKGELRVFNVDPVLGSRLFDSRFSIHGSVLLRNWEPNRTVLISPFLKPVTVGTWNRISSYRKSSPVLDFTLNLCSSLIFHNLHY